MTQRARSLVLGGARAEVFADKSALVEAAAGRLTTLARECIADRGRFTIALAGGSTPADLYRRLAHPEGSALDWTKVHFFFGDERSVGPVHPDSNYRMAHECLFGPASVPEANIHRIEAERPPSEAAAEYEKTLRSAFGMQGDDPPCFDLVLLGLGADAHTASLFPNTSALDVKDRLVVANAVPKLSTNRITLTATVLNAAAHVWFVVAGASKAQAVHDVLLGDPHPHERPAQLISVPGGELIWWLDEPAAASLG
jgi:6-phosphogluconolactonase